jgi:hypothetical protein
MAYTPLSAYSFNPYAVGNKIYGGGRSFPTSGPVDPTGYKERDLQTKARRNAILRRLRAQGRGSFMSADYLRGM